jgi:hypothetical protein
MAQLEKVEEYRKEKSFYSDLIFFSSSYEHKSISNKSLIWEKTLK